MKTQIKTLFFVLLLATTNSVFCIQYGSFTNQGSRSYMEDRLSVKTFLKDAIIRPTKFSFLWKNVISLFGQKKIPENDIFFAGVFDGHRGSNVSELLKNELGKDFETELKASNYDIRNALIQSFARTNNSARQKGYRAGSTAIVAIINKDMVHIANVGDSRAVGSNGQSLSIDQDTINPTEIKRVNQYEKDGKKLYDIFPMTRAFGDFDLERFGLIAIPDITSYPRNSLDFIILASDGIWDCLESAEVSTFVKKRFTQKQTPERIARELAIWASIRSPKNTSTNNKLRTAQSAHEFFNTINDTSLFDSNLFPTLKTTHDNQAVIIIDLKK